MLQEFVEQNYLVIENNIVNNLVIWNGDTSQWTPPSGSIALVQATTPAMIWQAILIDGKITDYVLVEQIGTGGMGFIWDGTAVITNQPKPEIPTQIATTGTITA